MGSMSGCYSATRRDDGGRALVTVQRRRADFAISRALAISVAVGGYMGKAREPQVILKSDQRGILLEMGREGKFTAKSSVWDESRVFSSRTTMRSRSRTAAG